MSALKELGLTQKDRSPTSKAGIRPGVVKESITSEEQTSISQYLGEIRLAKNKTIFVGVTPGGNLAIADSITDFRLDTTENIATFGDMAGGKKIDLTQYDAVVTLYLDKTQAKLVRVVDLNRIETHLKIVATIPKGSMLSTTVAALDGQHIELTFSLTEFLQHFYTEPESTPRPPFFSLRSSRKTSVSTFFVLNIPDGALNLPVGQKNALAICLQWTHTELQQTVNDLGLSSVHILARFIESLIQQIDFESHDKYSTLIATIKALFMITSKKIKLRDHLRMRYSWDVSDKELTVITKIAAKIYDTRNPHPLILPQIIITAIAHYQTLFADVDSQAELFTRVVDWLATDPTGLLQESEPSIQPKQPQKPSPSFEHSPPFVKPSYSSNDKQYPACYLIDQKWLRVQTVDYYSRGRDSFNELHTAQDISEWCEELCSLLGSDASADMHLRFHILRKLDQYIQKGSLLDGHVQLIGKDDKKLEMTVQAHLYSRATQILHSMAVQDTLALQRSGFLEASFRESGALHFMCHMYSYESDALCEQFMQSWLLAHVQRIQKFTPPFNAQVVAAGKELITQIEFFLENAVASTSKASIQQSKLLIHWVKSVFNTAPTSLYPKFVTPTLHGGVDPIDFELFTESQWKLTPELEIPVFALENNIHKYKKWVESLVTTYTSTDGATPPFHVLQKLQNFYQYIAENKKLQSLSVPGENATLYQFVRNNIDEARLSHIKVLTGVQNSERCRLLILSVHMEPEQFSLIPDQTLQRFAEQANNILEDFLKRKTSNVSDEMKSSLLLLLETVLHVTAHCKNAKGKFYGPGVGAKTAVETLQQICNSYSKYKQVIAPSSFPVPRREIW